MFTGLGALLVEERWKYLPDTRQPMQVMNPIQYPPTAVYPCPIISLCKSGSRVCISLKDPGDSLKSNSYKLERIDRRLCCRSLAKRLVDGVWMSSEPDRSRVPYVGSHGSRVLQTWKHLLRNSCTVDRLPVCSKSARSRALRATPQRLAGGLVKSEPTPSYGSGDAIHMSKECSVTFCAL